MASIFSTSCGSSTATVTTSPARLMGSHAPARSRVRCRPASKLGRHGGPPVERHVRAAVVEGQPSGEIGFADAVMLEQHRLHAHLAAAGLAQRLAQLAAGHVPLGDQVVELAHAAVTAGGPRGPRGGVRSGPDGLGDVGPRGGRPTGPRAGTADGSRAGNRRGSRSGRAWRRELDGLSELLPDGLASRAGQIEPRRVLTADQRHAGRDTFDRGPGRGARAGTGRTQEAIDHRAAQHVAPEHEEVAAQHGAEPGQDRAIRLVGGNAEVLERDAPSLPRAEQALELLRVRTQNHEGGRDPGGAERLQGVLGERTTGDGEERGAALARDGAQPVGIAVREEHGVERSRLGAPGARGRMRPRECARVRVGLVGLGRCGPVRHGEIPSKAGATAHGGRASHKRLESLGSPAPLR
jgi:hypothetical protein